MHFCNALSTISSTNQLEYADVRYFYDATQLVSVSVLYLSQVPKLRKLKWYGFYHIDQICWDCETNLCDVEAHGHMTIADLDLHSMNLNIDTIVKCAPRLKNMVLGSCMNLNLDAFTRFQFLQRLTLWNGDASVQELPLLKTLRYLCVMRCEMFKTIPALPNLDTLHLVQLPNLFTLPQNLPSLSTLLIEDCEKLMMIPQVILSKLHDLSLISCSCGLRRYTVPCICPTNGFNHEQLVYCRSLRTLKLCGCRKHPHFPENFEKLMCWSKDTLETLTIDHYCDIDPIQHFNKLSHLSVSNSSFKDGYIGHLPNLRVLHCKLKDQKSSFFVLENLPHVETVRVDIQKNTLVSRNVFSDNGDNIGIVYKIIDIKLEHRRQYGESEARAVRSVKFIFYFFLASEGLLTEFSCALKAPASSPHETQLADC